MQIDKTQYDALSYKAVKVLGHEVIEQMFHQQNNIDAHIDYNCSSLFSTS